MPKLFLFGIGGTGSRVLRSLTMLMAAGVPIKNCDRIVPILIDPDSQNADMLRAVELLKTYKRLHKKLGRDAGFFGKEVSTLADMEARGEGKIKDTFIFDFGGINQSFRDFIHFPDLEPDTQSLMQLLYTDDNLNSPLTVGFKGSPNVGSVVLNQLKASPEIRFFADNFQTGDRIFIISSIFGGTGAAGFPLLLKNLRDPDSGLQNAGAIAQALVGAITVLPYFALQTDDGSRIDSNTFLTKTKAALSYYRTNLNDLNALYYLADVSDKPYENREGGAAQKNDAHLVELLSALSVVDFMEYDAAELTGGSTRYHEYGLRDDRPEIFLDHLYADTKDKIARPLTQFMMLAKYYREHLEDDKGKNYYKGLKLDHAMRNDSFYRDLGTFLDGYYTWLSELAGNRRGFEPFNLDTDDFNTLINGKTIATGLFKKGLTPGYFQIELNRAEQKMQDEPDPNRKFIKLFHEVTGKAYEEKVPTI
ncbi:hypothetical protein SAMN05421823_107131 [Catalinimonas alkaloidigena]|uniref:Tubulin/FtsZ family, GTPase domain n=1 Tax=Catalinimonas alkaloidigena TaxID=1075417 RepID=A0A1G9LQ61_9BACT|nr:hypothetical protein [Catalinimonas alkaloidigena]SDL64066.1 hypothetical protein SAMN05421823_107131 [Catalinimonas alkaloidigena]